MENETISCKNVFKFIFLKKHSIAQLCDYYGNPQDVRDHLQLLSDGNRLLAISLKNNIRVLNQMVEKIFGDIKKPMRNIFLKNKLVSVGA